MIQAREKGNPIFPVIMKPCQLPELLNDTQKTDLTTGAEGGYRRLALGLKENGLDPADVFDSGSRAPTIRWRSARIADGLSPEVVTIHRGCGI